MKKKTPCIYVLYAELVKFGSGISSKISWYNLILFHIWLNLKDNQNILATKSLVFTMIGFYDGIFGIVFNLHKGLIIRWKVDIWIFGENKSWVGWQACPPDVRDTIYQPCPFIGISLSSISSTDPCQSVVSFNFDLCQGECWWGYFTSSNIREELTGPQLC